MKSPYLSEALSVYILLGFIPEERKRYISNALLIEPQIEDSSIARARYIQEVINKIRSRYICPYRRV
jgi:hypothetical protein